MAGGRNQQSKLSKNVMQMKFMQRSVLRSNIEENDDESNRAVDDEHWVLDVPPLPKKESVYNMIPSYAVCENLRYGRMSYKGFNPEVEKLMKANDTETELIASKEKEEETEVNDDEMAKRYQSLIGIISKKFAQKRKQKSGTQSSGPSSEKRQFMKPEND